MAEDKGPSKTKLEQLWHAVTEWRKARKDFAEQSAVWKKKIADTKKVVDEILDEIEGGVQPDLFDDGDEDN